MIRLKFRLYKNIWSIFLILVLICLFLLLIAPAGVIFNSAGYLVLFCLTALFWIQKQRTDDLKLFTGLFESYNERYSRIRDQLAAIYKDVPSKELSGSQINVLVAYFNLCSEQFFYYSNGHILPEAWEAWRNGMRTYYYNDRIRKLWDAELKHPSHYGFSNQWLK